MPQKTKTNSYDLQTRVARVAKVHFGFIAAYAVALVIFDTWNLITTEGMSQRWTLGGVMLIVNTAIWFLARSKLSLSGYYRLLAVLLIVADVAFVSINVYLERGMASRMVALYAVPLVVSGVLFSRRALYAAAALCTAGYVMAVMRYFNEFYGEGYKVELYGVTFLYSASFFVIAAIMNAIGRPEE